MTSKRLDISGEVVTIPFPAGRTPKYAEAKEFFKRGGI
jgi:hypothetical protein